MLFDQNAWCFDQTYKYFEQKIEFFERRKSAIDLARDDLAYNRPFILRICAFAACHPFTPGIKKGTNKGCLFVPLIYARLRSS